MSDYDGGDDGYDGGADYKYVRPSVTLSILQLRRLSAFISII